MVTLDDMYQFWVRRGTDNRLMTTDEIEFKFAEFAKVSESASSELAAIRTDLSSTAVRDIITMMPLAIKR
jgi:hypothetical protein